MYFDCNFKILKHLIILLTVLPCPVTILRDPYPVTIENTLTDFSTLSSTLTLEIRTRSSISSLKKVPSLGRASLYRPTIEVTRPGSY